SASAVDWEERAEANKPELPTEVEIDTDDPGFAIYKDNCLSCHGEQLEGSQAAPGLIGTEYSADEIAEIAVDGIGSMPPDQFTGTDEELEQLVDFIISVNEEAE